MPKELIVFPSQRIYDAYWEGEGTILPPPHATTLSNLIRRLWNETGLLASPLSPGGRLLLLQQLTEAYTKANPTHFFHAVISTPGFLRHLEGFLSECKKALLSPEVFRRLARSKELSQEERRRCQALGDLFAAYEQALTSHDPPLVDADDVERRLTVLLEENQRPFRCLDEHDALYFSHLTHLTPLRFRLIEALAGYMGARGKAVGLSVIFDPQMPEGVFRFAEHALTPIEKLGAETPAVNPPDFVSIKVPDRPPALKFLLEHLCRRYPYVRNPEDDPPPEGADRHVKLVAARGKYEEIEAIARRIRVLLEEGSCPAHSIAVICRDIAPYGQIVEEIFHRYRLPFSFRRGWPCLSCPPIRALLAVYDYLADPSEGALLAKVLLSGYLGYAGPKNAAAIRRVLPRAEALSTFGDDPHRAVQRVAQQAEQRLASGGISPQERAREEALVAGAGLTAKTLTAFLADTAPLRKPQPLTAHLLALEAFIQKRGLSERLCTDDHRLLARDQQSLALLSDTLARLRADAEQVGFVAPQSPAQVAQLLREALTDVSVSWRPPLEGVEVMRVEDAIGLTFDTVFVVGLTSHLFPQRCYDDPFLTEHLKAIVNRLLAEESPSPPLRAFMPLSARYLEEAYLFFLAVFATRQTLYLCRHEQDENERPVVPSPFFQTVADILGLDPPASGREEGHDERSTPRSFTSVPELAFCFEKQELLGRLALDQKDSRAERRAESAALAQALRRHPDLRASYELWARRSHLEEDRRRFFLFGDDPSPASGVLVSETAKAWIVDRHLRRPLSAKQLESFGFCPYQFFAQHVLKIEEPQEPTWELTPVSEGTLYHLILERFLNEKKNRNQSLWNDQDLPLLHRIIAETASELFELHLPACALHADRPAASCPLWEAQVESIKRHLATFFQQRLPEAFKNATVLGSEVSFGPLGDWPAVERTVSVAGGPLRITFHGRIDAVLDTGDQIAVVDFKTTKDLAHKRYTLLLTAPQSPKGTPDQIGRVGWQLPLYGLAVQATLPPEAPRVVPLLLALKARGQSGASLELTWNSAAEAFFEQNMCRTLEDIRRGRFEVAPLDEEVSCPHCAFRTLCRFEPAEEAEGEKGEDDL